LPAPSSPLLAPAPLEQTPSSPLSGTPYQEGWELCQHCRKHYHRKSYFYCWFCNFK
jgi:hypothetical protein